MRIVVSPLPSRGRETCAPLGSLRGPRTGHELEDGETAPVDMVCVEPAAPVRSRNFRASRSVTASQSQAPSPRGRGAVSSVSSTHVRRALAMAIAAGVLDGRYGPGGQ